MDDFSRRNLQSMFDDISNVTVGRDNTSNNNNNSTRRERDSLNTNRDTTRPIFNENVRRPDIVETLQSLITSYNENFTRYQDNTYRLITNLQEIWNNDREVARLARANRAQRFAPRANVAAAGAWVPRTHVAEAFMQPVPIVPTNAQITDATEMILYSSTSPTLNTSCPISIENFEDDEPLLRILHCQHAFRPEAIQTWFRTNTRCPVCRYDIREYNDTRTVTRTGPTDDTYNATSQAVADLINAPPGEISQAETDLINSTADMISRALQQSLRGNSIDNMHVLTFDIPTIVGAVVPTLDVSSQPLIIDVSNQTLY